MLLTGGTLPLDNPLLGGTVAVLGGSTRAGNQAPTITSPAKRAFPVGVPSTFTVTATGIPTPALSEVGALPKGVTFVDNHDGTATLAGTPGAPTGTFDLTITAANGVAPDAVQNFQLIITGAVLLPVLRSDDHTTFTAGAAGKFTVTATGFPTPTLSETGALPKGVTFVDNHDGTATLAGTPAPNTGGTYNLTITAANGVVPDAVQSFTLTVNQAPAFTSAAAAAFGIGAAGTYTVTTSGFPIAKLSEVGPLPAGVSFVDNHDGTATLAGTPASTGTYNLTITADNHVAPAATQNFTLTINQPPAITSAASTVFTVGVPGTFTVRTIGFPTGTLSWAGQLPAGMSFVDNHDGTATIAGTPIAAGTYNLMITAANGVAPDAVRSFTLTVNQAPAITSPAARAFAFGVPSTFTVTTTGFPTPALSEAGALPTGVSFVDNHDDTATIAGTPTAAGTYNLMITAANGVVPDAVKNFQLIIATPVLAPMFRSDDNATFTAGAAGTFTVTATGFPTPTLSKVGALPAGVSFVDNGDGTATLAGTPAPNAGGTYNLTITAANSAATRVQNFVLNVVTVPPAKVLHLQRFGIRAQPTRIVLSFDEPLNPFLADLKTNYVFRPVVRGRVLTRPRQAIRVASAVYNPATRTVTLTTAQRLNLSQVYQITVNGQAPSGLTNQFGTLLDGKGNGLPGSNFVLTFTGKSSLKGITVH
jgi:hypothetical protein